MVLVVPILPTGGLAPLSTAPVAHLAPLRTPGLSPATSHLQLAYKNAYSPLPHPFSVNEKSEAISLWVYPTPVPTVMACVHLECGSSSKYRPLKVYCVPVQSQAFTLTVSESALFLQGGYFNFTDEEASSDCLNNLSQLSKINPDAVSNVARQVLASACRQSFLSVFMSPFVSEAILRHHVASVSPSLYLPLPCFICYYLWFVYIIQTWALRRVCFQPSF